MAVEREWIAILPSMLKASTAMAADLPDHEKLPAPKGARLSGVLLAEDRSYWVVAQGVLDGRAVPANLRYVYKGQWQLRALDGAQTPSAPVAVAQPAIRAKERSSRRRRFAAFKARLSQGQGDG